MHSLFHRASNLFSFTLSALLGLLALVSVSGPLLHLARGDPPAITPNITVSRVSVELGRLGYYHDYSTPAHELGKIQFDVTADLTGLWNWNTKLLFVYMLATFETPTHVKNEMLVWDDILRTKEDSFLLLKDQRPEYFASDLHHSLKGIPANLTLVWNVIPKVGVLFTKSKGRAQLVFPERTKPKPIPQ